MDQLRRTALGSCIVHRDLTMNDEQEIGRAWIENRLRNIASVRGLTIVELSCLVLTGEGPEFTELGPEKYLFVVKTAKHSVRFTVSGAMLEDLANHKGEQVRLGATMREVIGKLRHGPTT